MFSFLIHYRHILSFHKSLTAVFFLNVNKLSFFCHQELVLYPRYMFRTMSQHWILCMKTLQLHRASSSKNPNSVTISDFYFENCEFVFIQIWNDTRDPVNYAFNIEKYMFLMLSLRGQDSSVQSLCEQWGARWLSG